MKQLFINKGSRKLSIRGFEGVNKKPCVIINCMEYWEPCDDDGFEDAEENDATFYLNEDDIDLIIEKMKEAKAYIKNNIAN